MRVIAKQLLYLAPTAVDSHVIWMKAALVNNNNIIGMTSPEQNIFHVLKMS